MEFYPEDHRDYLRQELVQRIRRRPQYSLRAFARDLELSPSTLSEYFNNKHPLSGARIKQIAKKLALPSLHQQHWLDLIAISFSKDKATVNLAKLHLNDRIEKSGGKLSLQRFKALTTWYYLCVYHLIQLDPQKFTQTSALAKHLGISKDEAKQAISCLLQLGLLQTQDEQLVAIEEFILVGDNTPSSHIRQYHAQFIEKSFQAVDQQNFNTRETATVLLTIRSSDLAKMKTEVQEFADRMCAKYAVPQAADELYCLSLNLFSLKNEKDQL